MGMMDFVDHIDNENAVVIVPESGFTRLLGKNGTIKSIGRKMKRKAGGVLWVFDKAKVKKISKAVARDVKEGSVLTLAVTSSDGETDKSIEIGLEKVRAQKIDNGIRFKKKIELWKSMPDKPKNVSDFLIKQLSTEQKDEKKRNAIFSFLLGESRGDRIMTFTIINAYYRMKTTEMTNSLRNETGRNHRNSAKIKRLKKG